METLLNIIAYTLPSVIVLLTTLFLVKSYLKNEEKVKLLELKKDDKQITVPLRLQAYERLVILMERIGPGQLVVRLHHAGMEALDLQTAMIRSIREEFEHNLAQQIYVSQQSWATVKNAKEEVIRHINTVAANLKEDGTAEDLAELILKEWMQKDTDPLQQSIDLMKGEVRNIF
jgi:hypothetical protein